MRHARMQAFVYKSQRKTDTFVYLAARDEFEKIPEPLRAQLGEQEMQDALIQSRLARAQTLVGLYKALGGGWTATRQDQ